MWYMCQRDMGKNDTQWFMSRLIKRVKNVDI